MHRKLEKFLRREHCDEIMARERSYKRELFEIESTSKEMKQKCEELDHAKSLLEKQLSEQERKQKELQLH